MSERNLMCWKWLRKSHIESGERQRWDQGALPLGEPSKALQLLE